MVLLDLVFFCVFLALNCIVGLQYGRKITTLRQYAIGDKQFSTATSIATLLATSLGGELLMYNPGNAYQLGLVVIIPLLLGKFFAYGVTAWVVTVRMGKLLNALSVAEAMGTLYGKGVQIMTAVSGIPLVVMAITIQFYFIAEILGLVFGSEGLWMTLLTVGVIIAYSAFGGIYAVTFTDVLQFIVMCICLPILILAMYHSCQDPAPIRTALVAHPYCGLGRLRKLFDGDLACMMLVSYFLETCLPTQLAHPALFQRIVMTRSVFQAKRTFTYACFLYCLLMGSALLLGLLLVAYNPGLRQQEIVPYMIAVYEAYPVFKVLLAIGVVSMAMSTADSYLNTSAVLFVNDLIKPFQCTKDKKGPLTGELAMVRIWSFGIGILALLLTHTKGGIDVIGKISYIAFHWVRSTYFVPFLLAILGFRSIPRAVVSSIVVGGVTAVGLRIFVLPHGKWSLVWGMLANGIVLFAGHYLWVDPKDKTLGWVGSTRPAEGLLPRPSVWRVCLQQATSFRFYSYCQGLLPGQETTYSLFAFYVLFTVYIPCVKWGRLWVEAFPLLCAVVIFSILLLVAVFVTYPIWPVAFRWKPFIVFLWPIGVGYLLFSVSMIFLLLSGFQSIQCIICIINLLITSLFMPWQVIVSMMGIGSIVALFLLGSLTKTPLLCFFIDHLSLEFKIMYGMVLFLFLLLILYTYQHKKKLLEQVHAYHVSLLRAKEREQLHNLQYQAYMKETLISPHDSFQFVKAALYRLVERVPEERKIVQQALAQCDAYINYQKHTFAYLMDHVVLSVEQVTVARLLSNLSALLKSLNFHHTVRFCVTTQYTCLSCDVEKVTHLLVTSIRNLLPQIGTTELITLWLQDTSLSYQFQSVPDPNYTRSLPAIGFIITQDEELSFALQLSYPGNTKQEERRIPYHVVDFLQQENERIIDAHYGYHEIVAMVSGTRMLYVLPVDVRSIRSKVVDELPLSAEVDLVEDAYSLSVEKSFLAALQANQVVGIYTIQGVIRHIKQIHKGQLRQSGDLFYTHPMIVAMLVLSMTQDHDAIIAALLHDTVEDTQFSLSQVTYQYGQDVSFIVSKLTHLDPAKKSVLTEQENQQQLAAYHDPRVVMVKLADRLHNMRTIAFHSFAKQRRIAQETLDFYVPLGRTLRMAAVDQVVDEIEAHCLTIIGQTFD